MYLDPWYFLLVIPALLFGMWAQSKVNRTFQQYSGTRNLRGMTGADAARRILDQNGLYHVKVERIAGNLTDNYDPRSQVVHLSDTVYGSTSVAAIGVAAHETGHAVQHAEGYAPLKIRTAIIPITQIGSSISPILIILGIFLSLQPLVEIGILLFASVAVFQLVTLPVEYNASRRALATLDGTAMLTEDEVAGAARVLDAAALTYVAALLSTLAQLLRLVLLYGRRRND